jgi:hypothetical protein
MAAANSKSVAKNPRPAPVKRDAAAAAQWVRAQEVIDFIAINGLSLRKAGIEAGITPQSFLRLCDADDALAEQYARAIETRYDVLADDIMQISDDGLNDTYVDDDGKKRTDHDVIARSKLRVDSRKWLLSKLAPKKYGDRVAQEHSGPDGGPIGLAVSNLNLRGLSDAELATMQALVAKAATAK